VYDSESREIKRLRIEVSERFKGRLVLIPRRRCKALSFLRRGVSGAVGVVLLWLLRLEGVEAGDLIEGETSLHVLGCAGDVFEPWRPLEGVVGYEVG